MLVSSLHQRVEKRNSHKSRPVSFKLIVNPKLMPQKPRNKDHSSLFHKLPQKRLIALIISLTLVAVLVSLCFPIFPQNRELKEFDFPEQDKTMVSLLQDELSSYYTQPEPEQIMSPPLKNLKTIVYKVKKGDSLSGIAQKYKLNIGTIIGFNNIRNARSLVIGTTLTIPNYNGLLYTVKKGDSLSLISNKYDVSLNNLLDWNHLSHAGQADLRFRLAQQPVYREEGTASRH
ncbi:MAG: LysM peptidoglycan-binding domain-containing protein [Spirochaetia bacterium]